mgnify:FL=1
MKQITILLFIFILALTMAGCKSGRNLQKDKDEGATTEALYKYKVVGNSQSEKAVTGKMKISIQAGDKNISLSGNLKMMRNDVIQLSLSFLGIEVGRMEFSPKDVLILDRVHKQYARVDYTKIDFLQSAKLDFNALQALFWNELFVPGTADVSTALNYFRVSESGDHTLLILSTAPQFDYSFLTITNTAKINRTTIRPKNIDNQDNLECRYSNFVKLGGKTFPSSIRLQFKGDKKTYTLDMNLSNLNNDSDWTTHTNVSSKYSPMDINKLLDKLAGAL